MLPDFWPDEQNQSEKYTKSIYIFINFFQLKFTLAVMCGKLVLPVQGHL